MRKKMMEMKKVMETAGTDHNLGWAIILTWYHIFYPNIINSYTLYCHDLRDVNKSSQVAVTNVTVCFVLSLLCLCHRKYHWLCHICFEGESPNVQLSMLHPSMNTYEIFLLKHWPWFLQTCVSEWGLLKIQKGIDRDFWPMIPEVKDSSKVVFVKMLRNALWFQNSGQLSGCLLAIESTCTSPQIKGGSKVQTAWVSEPLSVCLCDCRSDFCVSPCY